MKTATDTTYCQADDGRAHQSDPQPAIALCSTDEDIDLGTVPMCGECMIAAGVIEIDADVNVEWITKVAAS